LWSRSHGLGDEDGGMIGYRVGIWSGAVKLVVGCRVVIYT
jgi:hypothetical protein